MATAAFPLVLVVLSATSGISAGFEVTAPSPVVGALGEEVSIVCKADDMNYPDSCSFTRYVLGVEVWLDYTCADVKYRMTGQDGKNLPLTWDVPSCCLGSR